MEVVTEGAKTKTLAVFENVETKERSKKRKKFKTHRFSDDDSSQSESELVNDDELREEASKRKKHGVRVRLKTEQLIIKCEWDNCTEVFTNLDYLADHLITHGEDAEELICKWADCPDPDNILSSAILIRHICYHGYLAKLVNIGRNVLNRNNFPECSFERKLTIDVPSCDYTCDWKGCEHLSFITIFDFLNHVECHVNAAPSGKEVGSKEIIPCMWFACDRTFSTRYKLGDHLKIHTKERTIACPQCMSMFSTKTTFSDHRKRQLKSDMRSYQCSQCLKLFSIEKLLSDHMRSHINLYKCTLCDMTSTKPSMLAKHYRFRHMDVRPFSCKICNKTCVTKSNLKAHLLTHAEKPFKCDQCEFGCKSRVGLKSHMTKVHGLEMATYECQVCKERYRRGDYLTYHLIKKHKFHWPSGHCRFRYRKDSDGIHRLQTVRYESLEVTEQMLKSESNPTTKNSSAVTYNVTYDKDAADQYKLTVLEDAKDVIDIGPVELSDPNNDASENTDGKQIIITIEDVDESGNVVQSRQFDSNVIFFDDMIEGGHQSCKRDMPVFETICVKEE